MIDAVAGGAPPSSSIAKRSESFELLRLRLRVHEFIDGYLASSSLENLKLDVDVERHRRQRVSEPEDHRVSERAELRRGLEDGPLLKPQEQPLEWPDVHGSRV